MAKEKTGQPKAAAGDLARVLDLKKVESRGRRLLDASAAPQSYDAAERTVEITLSTGSAVERWYGIEALSMDQAAVNIQRLASSGIPFLDSHNSFGIGSVIGRIVDVWFAEGQVKGRAKFAETDAGKMAEGMVARGEMAGVSIGYRVDDWTITDTDGTVIDPEKSILNIDDKLTFTATRWELLEVSLVSVPADPDAMIRSNDVAAEQNLRASPMGKGAKKITIANGDRSVSYEYGADAPQERAWPGNQKGTPTMPATTLKSKAGLRAVRGKREDDTKPTVDKDGYWVNTAGDYCDTEGKKVDEPIKADRADPTIDTDGYWVDEAGNYCDEKGNKVDEPMLAETAAGRAMPAVDDDGYYVDDEGNYVDAEGVPSDDPVTARDEDDAEDRKRAARIAAAKRAATASTSFSRKDTAELVRIGEQARSHKIELDVASAIERNLKPAALRKIMFDKLAARSAETAIKGAGEVTIKVTRDERQGRAGAMELALVRQLLSSRGSDGIDYAPKSRADKKFVETHDARAETYMGMGFVEIAAECLGHRGNIRTPVQALGIVERAFQSTSDFPAIFQNVLNKSLLARYELAVPTYQSIAVERPFNDFRPHPMVRAGDFPSLQPVTQAGELKSGNSLDSGETVSVLPYGVIFPISRQMIVNDQLGAIDQILGSAGDTVRVFENTTFFAMFNSNPKLLQDGKPVFDPTHSNLAPQGNMINVPSVGAGRASMRAMRSLSKLLLNVPPRIILTGPSMETMADQIVASITPQLNTSVNPFSGKLQSVSDANITDTSWYLMADPARVPNYVYGFLNGSTGPRVRTFEPFGVQGVQVSLEHDFGCGAIDFRGAYRNPGSLTQA